MSLHPLASSLSPYLLQHTQDKVRWLPWGEAAFAEARAKDQLLLLSSGFASCHYCHRIGRELFQDPAFADFVNQNFVCVLVDKEERPDVDALYLAASVALTGGGAWPLQAFLTSELEPVFTSSFLPLEDSPTGPGMFSLVRKLAELWKNERAQLLAQGQGIGAQLKRAATQQHRARLSSTSVHRARGELLQSYDRLHGGFGGGARFPAHASLRFLLEDAVMERQASSGQMLTGCLDAMMRGALYDQIGGGFFRYTEDPLYQVPHFEKLLVDNVQLAELYLDAFRLTRREAYLRVARETLDFILRELASPEGGFFTSLDAESHGEAGRYYLLDQDDVRRAIGQRSPEVCEFLSIRDSGPFKGKSVPSLAKSAGAIAAAHQLSEAELASRVDLARAALLSARSRRPAPMVDDQELACGNGLALALFAKAAWYLGEPRYQAAASRCLEHLASVFVSSAGQVFHSVRHGHHGEAAYLRDAASLGLGFLSYEEHQAAPAAQVLFIAQETEPE